MTTPLVTPGSRLSEMPASLVRARWGGMSASSPSSPGWAARRGSRSSPTSMSGRAGFRTVPHAPRRLRRGGVASRWRLRRWRGDYRRAQERPRSPRRHSQGAILAAARETRAECESPYLLVEGRELDRGPLHPNAIRGACLTAVELGIALLRTEDRDDSARWLHRLAVRRQRVEHAPDRPAYAQRPKVLTGVSAAEAALAVVPGISVVCARALLARFGSVQAVLQATYVDELVAVPGIGSERARALEQTFHRQVAAPTSSEAAASAAMSDRHRSPT